MKYSVINRKLMSWRSHTSVFKRRLLLSFVFDQLVTLIKDANTLPALSAKHLAQLHDKICPVATCGNTVLRYVPVDTVGETNIFNHSHESGETSGA